MADYLWPFAPVVLAAALVTWATTPYFYKLSFRVGAAQFLKVRRATRPARGPARESQF